MTTLIRIEHPVRDFDAWKAAFDRDPIGRQAGGVCRYRIFRSIADPGCVAIDLEFDDESRATAFREALQRMWETPLARDALAGAPSVDLVACVEDVAT